MRARDVRAIVFWAASTAALLVAALLLSRSLLVAAGLAVAWSAFVLTRPRMRRVMRRLRGEPDWSGYFDNDGTRMKPSFPRAPITPAPRAPGAAPAPPRPVEGRSAPP